MEVENLLDIDYNVDYTTTLYFITQKQAYPLTFYPFFYAKVEDGNIDEIKTIKIKEKDEIISPIKIEEASLITKEGKTKLYKIYVNKPSHILKIKHELRKKGIKVYEWDIPLIKRAIGNYNLIPLEGFSFEDMKSFNAPFKPKIMAFDIETYNPKGIPNPSTDPIILISYAMLDKKGVLSTKPSDKPFVTYCKDEKTLLTCFANLIQKEDPDILLGFNSGTFDLPYIYERAKKLKINIDLGRYNLKSRKISRGYIKAYKIGGRVHFDLYYAIRLLANIGALNLERYTLYEAYKEVVGKEKPMVERRDIWKIWDNNNNETDKLFDYSLMDAISTLELGDALINIFIELSKIARMPLFYTAISTTGQLVENLLILESQRRGIAIPPRPKESEVYERAKNPIEGAFVKMPKPGIYNNIAVLDFRGLYPSLIVTYNIDPLTLCKDGKIKSPNGYAFKEQPTGIIPSILRKLIELRKETKKRLKEAKKETEEYKILFARDKAIKILSNSFYGYLGYARSRFYCRECAASVTAWGREHIKRSEKEAEKWGFTVLYIDTDSLFLLLNDKKKEDVLAFLDYINKKLPGVMYLDLEGFYKRGVFVSKKSETKGAKKKYALLNEDGSIKIKGFELVRRDWSNVAKKTQEEVLKIILNEGSKEKAINYVKDVIKKLRKGEVEINDLVIYTQLNKDIWNYEASSPELQAAKRLSTIRKVGKGSLIGYVITKSGKSISDKAYPKEMAKDYDPEYYINHQILPAVMKILKELGVKEEELTFSGKQKGLTEFFKP